MSNLYNTKYFQASVRFQKDPNRLVKIVNIIKSYNPKNVLDVGCGIGVLVKELNKQGIETKGLDFAPDLQMFWEGDTRFRLGDAKNLPFADGYFDLVISTDFFEHIEKEEIGQVASEMKRVGKKVVAFVADNKGTKLTKRQAMYHVTHEPMSWWQEKLSGIDVFSSHDVW